MAQKKANQRYQEKQRQLRQWADDIAEGLDLTRDELLEIHPDGVIYAINKHTHNL